MNDFANIQDSGLLQIDYDDKKPATNELRKRLEKKLLEIKEQEALNDLSVS